MLRPRMGTASITRAFNVFARITLVSDMVPVLDTLRAGEPSFKFTLY